MKVFISTMPAAGHVNPFIPIATELVKRGHQVVWHTAETYRAKVETTGATFYAFDKAPDLVKIPVQPDEGTSGMAAGVSVMRRLFVDRVAGQVADYRKILETFPADVLLVDMCSLGALILRDFDGPVWTTLGINPLITFDPEIPPFGQGGPPATTWLGQMRNSFFHWMARMLFMPKVTKLVNDERVRLGLQPYGKEMEFQDMPRSPFLHIMPTTMAFEYPRKNIARQIHFVRPLIPPPDPNFTLPTWWAELEQHKGRVVHVTQGTYAIDEANLVRPTISALAKEDVLLVVTSPKATSTLIGHPANVRIADFIPHPLLLPHVNCMITNAGYNGVLTALAHGVPLVCAGRTEDKADVSGRVAWCGAGVDLQTDKPSEGQIREAVRKVLGESTHRDNATRVKEDFERHESAKEACTLLEQLAETQTAVVRAQ